MNCRTADAPCEYSFLVRFLLTLAFGILVSSSLTTGGCADDAQQPTTDNSSLLERLDALEDQVAELEDRVDLVETLESRVHSLELEHMVSVADNQKLQSELDKVNSQLDPLVKTFPIVGTDTPDPTDNMVYVNAALNLGNNDLLVRNIAASNVSSDQATFSESWTMGVNHVESIAFKQDNYERFMYGFDLQWIHQISPFTMFGHDEDGQSVITFTTGHVRVNNLRAYNQLRGDTLLVDTYGAMPELNVWDHLMTHNLEAYSVEVKQEATFGINDGTGPAVTISQNGLTSDREIYAPSQISVDEKMWLNIATELFDFTYTIGEGWSIDLRTARLNTHRGLIAEQTEADSAYQAFTARGISHFLHNNQDGSPSFVFFEGSATLNGSLDAGCMEENIPLCE